MEKRGSISQAMIISIVILLLTAGILFYFFKILPYKDTIDKEACRQSVLLRSQSFLEVSLAQKLHVPLNCKTEEIEITSTDPDFVKREMANAMYDCWWMLGEGELNFFGEGWTKNTYCTICSRIKFGENTQKKIGEIKDFELYLRDTKIPKKNMTYMEYFTGGNEYENIAETPLAIDTSKEYFVTYALIEKSAAIERISGIAVGTGIVVIGAYVGGAPGAMTGAKIGAIAGTAANWGAGALHDWITEKIQGSTFLVSFSLIPADADAIKGFGCESIQSIP